MTDGLYDRMFRSDPTDGLFLGVVIGVVTNAKDPNGLGRVRLKLPWLSDDAETDWARVAGPAAGKERGIFFPLEVDDEVLVAFEHGSPQLPFVIGALWNGKDKPPEPNADGKSDIRMIKSRSGHIVRLTDKSGSEKIEIIDKSGKNTVVIDSAKNTITITADADLTLESKTGKLSLKGKDVEVKASAGLTLEASGKAELKASGTLTVKGATVNIN